MNTQPTAANVSDSDVSLQGFAAHDPPSALYRFFRGLHGLRAIVDGTVKITAPCEFNDPFDFNPGIHPNIDAQPPTAAEIRRHFLAPGGLARQVYFQKWANGDEHQYRSVVETNVVNRPDLLVTLLQRERDGMVTSISNLFGVICLSAFTEDDLSKPMAIRHWSAYAENHRGLAIEFSASHNPLGAAAKAKWLFPINYVASRHCVGLTDFEDSSVAALLQALRSWAEHKSEDAWGNEKEWRLIAPFNDATPIPILKRIVDGRLMFFLQLWNLDAPDGGDADVGKIIRRIILGCRAPADLEKDVRTALGAPYLRHVELWRAYENPSSFGLQYVRLDSP